MDYSAYVFNEDMVTQLVSRSAHPLRLGFANVLTETIKLVIDGDPDLYDLINYAEAFPYNTVEHGNQFFTYMAEVETLSIENNGEWSNQDMCDVHERQHEGVITGYKSIIKQCIDSLNMQANAQTDINKETNKLVMLSRQLGKASNFDSFQDAFLLREDFHHSRNEGLAKANATKVDNIKPVKELAQDLASAIWRVVPTLSVNKTAEIIHDNIQKVLDESKEYECNLLIEKGLINKVPNKKNKENVIAEDHHSQPHRVFYLPTDEDEDEDSDYFLDTVVLKTAASIRRYIETVKPSEENVIAYRKANPNQNIRDKINTAQHVMRYELKCEDKSCRCKKY